MDGVSTHDSTHVWDETNYLIYEYLIHIVQWNIYLIPDFFLMHSHEAIDLF